MEVNDVSHDSFPFVRCDLVQVGELCEGGHARLSGGSVSCCRVSQHVWRVSTALKGCARVQGPPKLSSATDSVVERLTDDG